MSRINLSGDSMYSSSGSFKTVEIFEYFVRKTAQESESYKMGYTEAKEDSDFYDENGEFHYSWVQTQYDEDGTSYEECAQEMEREFDYAMRKKHLPIIVPIVEGNSECYIMPRVKTYSEVEGKLNNRVLKRRHKEITISLLARLRRARAKTIYRQMDGFPIENLIKLGILAKLSNEKIVSNLYWFMAENASNDLLRDMHTGNIGIYRRNLVTFDMGQICDFPPLSISKCYKQNLRGLKWSIKSRAELNLKKV
jgi:hypothetical protein